MSNWEKSYSKKYCNNILVNSPNLLDKFDANLVSYIPYASPLEDVQIQSYSSDKETVFLYLGKLTEGKGARHYSKLLEQFKRPLVFYGKAYDSFSKKMVESNPLIIKKGNLNSNDLKSSIEQVSQIYNLVGLSIIIPENESYKWQEANKDIDYIAMGIPFIGNERPPTLEKIIQGVGVLYTDSKNISRLLMNENDFYDKCVKKCIYFKDEYSIQEFERKLKAIYVERKK